MTQPVQATIPNKMYELGVSFSKQQETVNNWINERLPVAKTVTDLTNIKMDSDNLAVKVIKVVAFIFTTLVLGVTAGIYSGLSSLYETVMGSVKAAAPAAANLEAPAAAANLEVPAAAANLEVPAAADNLEAPVAPAAAALAAVDAEAGNVNALTKANVSDLEDFEDEDAASIHGDVGDEKVEAPGVNVKAGVAPTEQVDGSEHGDGSDVEADAEV